LNPGLSAVACNPGASC